MAASNILSLKLHCSILILLRIFVYSKRTSGFDMAPPAGAVLPNAAVSGLDLTSQSRDSCERICSTFYSL